MDLIIQDERVLYTETVSVNEQAKLFSLDVMIKKGIHLNNEAAKKLLKSMTDLNLNISVDTKTGDVLILGINGTKLSRPVIANKR